VDGDDDQPYAILSHQWDTQEVLFTDVEKGMSAIREGFSKVVGAIELSRRDGHKFLWIDTCCIDKSSSAELSEAINSMFRWYQEATVCYVYLSDVSSLPKEETFRDQFASSAWFTRGRTLRKLIAPQALQFHSATWRLLGYRIALDPPVSAITGIAQDILDGSRPLSETSIARRMSWAARRKTHRVEDAAYCLMGLFNVNMPSALRRRQQSLHTVARRDHQNHK